MAARLLPTSQATPDRTGTSQGSRPAMTISSTLPRPEPENTLTPIAQAVSTSSATLSSIPWRRRPRSRLIHQ